MTTEYWTGVATIPVTLITACICWVILRGLAWLAGRILLTAVTVRSVMSSQQRALFAATAYGAKRGHFVAFGNVGFAVFYGQDPAARSAAYDRVLERVSLNDLTDSEVAR